MAWRFEPGDDLQNAFRRVAAEEIARVRSSLGAPDADRNAVIHEARQSFKRLRALTRLAKPQLGADFDAENRRWRDAGRLLSGSRDTTVLLETFDKLVAEGGAKVSPGDVGRLRSRIAATGATKGAAENNNQVQEALGLLDDAEHAVARLRWPSSTRTLVRGLHKSQARLRRKWRKAHETGEADALHSWRKCVKDQAAQLSLFRRVVHNGLRERRNEEKQAAEILGNEHDLWLLGERLAEMRLPQGSARTRDVLRKEIEKHRNKLRREAFEKGETFSSEKSKSFAKAIGEAWVKASKRKVRKKRGKARRANGAARARTTSPAP
jgi:CHAD domain-containing protein